MLKISFANPHKYPLTKKEVFKAVENKIKNGIVEIAILDVNEMPKPDGILHDVLSYTAAETKDFKHPEGKNYLGEILICYPLAKKKALQLIEHGCWHLLGVHHD